MSSNRQEMLHILQSLMSSNNQIRKDAEKFYENIQETNTLLITNELVSILSDQYDLSIRSLCGILLRRQIEKILKLNLPDQSTILLQLKEMLLNLWIQESNLMILKRLNHIFAQIAYSSDWIDLIPTLLSKLELQPKREIILATLQFIEIFTEYVPDDISLSINPLGSFLLKYLNHPELEIQSACARSICACIVSLDDDVQRNAFKPALETILNILNKLFTSGDENDARNIIEQLVTIAQTQPLFFKSQLEHIVTVMFSIANEKSLDFSTRSIALELMVTFTESAPALARKCNSLIQGLVPLSMLMMLELDEEEDEWRRGRYSEETADDSCLVGEEAIERAVIGLGSKAIAPLVIYGVQQYVSNLDPRYRRAAIATMVRLAEGNPQQFKPHFDSALQLLGQLINDHSVRVQYEIIQVIYFNSSY